MFILVRPINCSLPTIQKRLFESFRTALTNEKNYGLALFVEKRYCNCMWGGIYFPTTILTPYGNGVVSLRR